MFMQVYGLVRLDFACARPYLSQGRHRPDTQQSTGLSEEQWDMYSCMQSNIGAARAGRMQIH